MFFVFFLGCKDSESDLSMHYDSNNEENPVGLNTYSSAFCVLCFLNVKLNHK